MSTCPGHIGQCKGYRAIDVQACHMGKHRDLDHHPADSYLYDRDITLACYTIAFQRQVSR